MIKQTLKKIAMFTWIMAISLIIVNATTISDGLSTFTERVLIDQNANTIGLSIDSESTTVQVADINGDTTTSGTVMDISGNALTTGMGLFVDSSSAGFTNVNGLVFARISNAGASGQVMQIENAGTGNGLLIDQNGNGIAQNIDNDGDDYGIYIDNAVGTNDALRILNSGTNNGIHIDQNGNQEAFFVEMANVASNAVRILDLGTGKGLFIDKNGNGIGMELDHEGTDTAFNLLNNGGDKTIYSFTESNTVAGNVASNWFYSNVAQTNVPLVKIDADHSGTTQEALLVENDGAGDVARFDSDSTGMHIALSGSDNVVCDGSISGIIANSTGIYACFGGTATVLAE